MGRRQTKEYACVCGVMRKCALLLLERAGALLGSRPRLIYFCLTNFSLTIPWVLKYRKWHKNCIIFNKFLTPNQARDSITIAG